MEIFMLFLGNAALVIPLFIWNRTESRSDIRQMNARLDASLQAIQAEIKDFHGRLCAIEERRK